MLNHNGSCQLDCSLLGIGQSPLTSPDGLWFLQRLEDVTHGMLLYCFHVYTNAVISIVSPGLPVHFTDVSVFYPLSPPIRFPPVPLALHQCLQGGRAARVSALFPQALSFRLPFIYLFIPPLQQLQFMLDTEIFLLHRIDWSSVSSTS